jgi:hypothetical protein
MKCTEHKAVTGMYSRLGILGTVADTTDIIEKSRVQASTLK